MKKHPPNHSYSYFAGPELFVLSQSVREDGMCYSPELPEEENDFDGHLARFYHNSSI
jgi:hypothetical protein